MMGYEWRCHDEYCQACCLIHIAPMTFDSITGADLEWARKALTEQDGPPQEATP
jgi:hypothetical protein